MLLSIRRIPAREVQMNTVDVAPATGDFGVRVGAFELVAITRRDQRAEVRAARSSWLVIRQDDHEVGTSHNERREHVAAEGKAGNEATEDGQLRRRIKLITSHAAKLPFAAARLSDAGRKLVVCDLLVDDPHEVAYRSAQRRIHWRTGIRLPLRQIAHHRTTYAKTSPPLSATIVRFLLAVSIKRRFAVGLPTTCNS